MNMRDWIKRHSIFTYLLLTMAWSFGLWSCLFMYIKPGELMTSAPPVAFVFVILGGFGPSIAGLLTTWLESGRDGLSSLWARLRIWQLGRWWLALLIIPAVTALTPLLRWAAGYPVDAHAMLAKLIPGILLGLTAGLMEEFGWRGFLLPHLLSVIPLWQPPYGWASSGAGSGTDMPITLLWGAGGLFHWCSSSCSDLSY